MKKTPVISWFNNDTVKHLRFPFSFFLLPVFLFALSQAETVNWMKAAVAFAILHLLMFPSSNGYNSFQDRDETSIGGLKNPPKVSENLFYATLLFDIAAVLFGLTISVMFSFFVLIFITMSRLYSYRGVRLKKYPVIGFLTVFIFQGAFIFMMTSAAVSTYSQAVFFTSRNIICMLISSLFIGSMYPLTQIYQHEADKNDGVTSLSYKLGYRGTFVFSAILFGSATILLFFHLSEKGHTLAFLLFLLFIMPVVFHLSKWYNRVKKNIINADFENTMRTNLLASVSMNLFFLILIINNYLMLF